MAAKKNLTVAIPTFKVVTVHKPLTKSVKADLAEEIESLVAKGYELFEMRERSAHINEAVFVRRRDTSLDEFLDELCVHEGQ